ncbi:MAG: glycoside hydrolase family 3 N-terminal domain-containing protein [Candidatus Marinimicrobia bacterium]|nr:glycoside hydrolase family 3 N-terminal domain-containing protein [Candidatus Neomarinimicrobiota bacterium]
MKKLLLLLLSHVLLLNSLSAQNDLWEHDSLRYKIGQMIIFGFSGETTPQVVLDEITEYNVGGVLLYRVYGNIENASQASQLVSELQANALIPLFIATDQEGGSVTNLRLSNGFHNSPSAYELGQQNDETTTREVASMFSSWFNDIGLNTNFAPVVDLRLNPGNVIGDRSYGADPNIVTQNAYWFMDEFHQNDQLTALKHFPGHGSSVGDSHLGFTDITDTWQEIELEPYYSLMDSGCVDMIMSAHVFNTDFDPLYPATLSAATINGLLRETMGYNGVVVTDAMMMGAITQNYGLTEAVTLAINAGVDILLYNWDDDLDGHRLVPLLVEHITTQVLSETIPRFRIEESYQRILNLKSRLNPETAIWNPQPAQPQITMFNYPNPFNPSTTLNYTLERDMKVTITILDVRGRVVTSIQNRQLQRAGNYELSWNGTGDHGGQQSSGIYFFNIQGPGFNRSLKIVKLG